MQNYHRLFMVSQERYDKLVNLASSGGGQAMKVQHSLCDIIMYISVRTELPPTVYGMALDPQIRQGDTAIS